MPVPVSGTVSALGVWCAADARLDNRAELAAQLLRSNRPLPSDEDLLVLGYRRWGTRLPEHLEGDFAFVLWDASEQSVFAARDPFGVRPLFFTAVSEGLFLASEVEQLLSIAEVDRELDDCVVLDYLEGDHRFESETFFRAIRRVRPGHWLKATSSQLHEKRYWTPPEPARGLTDDDCRQEFRNRFRTAVARRLEGDRPIVAQLSGGLDSSSTVCMADAICGEASMPRPVVHLASAVYPGLACDETPYIDAVVRQVRFPHFTWDGASAGPLDQEQMCVGHPWASSSEQSLEGDFQLAHRIGAGAILSGFGGDEVLFERGVFRELARRGWWVTLLRQLIQGTGYSTHGRWFFLREAAGETVPSSCRRMLRRLWPRRTSAPPQWLRLREALATQQKEPDHAAVPEAMTAQVTWNWLTRPGFWWAVELQSLRAARQGLELRLPFLDRSLVEFVLSLPVEHRLPHGAMKQLLRRAMAGLLPDVIAHRRQATTFEPVLSGIFERNRVGWRTLLSEARWESGPYVDQSALRESFDRLERNSQQCSTDRSFLSLLDIAQLERWLREQRDRENPRIKETVHESVPC
ncbi:MAG: hypothetical protein K2R98_18170 [Gemmataceae bacterium]|nr:hypothetical protein [Gemmataceae bacterium]